MRTSTTAKKSENGIQLNNKLCQNEKLEMSSKPKTKANRRAPVLSRSALFAFKLDKNEFNMKVTEIMPTTQAPFEVDLLFVALFVFGNLINLLLKQSMDI
jgi:hypothetical protein